VKNGTLIHMGFDKRIEPIDEAYRALPDVPLEFMDYTITVTSGSPSARVYYRYFQDGEGAVEAAQELIPPGIIGPFALETFYHPNTGFTVF